MTGGSFKQCWTLQRDPLTLVKNLYVLTALGNVNLHLIRVVPKLVKKKKKKILEVLWAYLNGTNRWARYAARGGSKMYIVSKREFSGAVKRHAFYK